MSRNGSTLFVSAMPRWSRQCESGAMRWAAKSAQGTMKATANSARPSATSGEPNTGTATRMKRNCSDQSVASSASRPTS